MSDTIARMLEEVSGVTAAAKRVGNVGTNKWHKIQNGSGQAQASEKSSTLTFFSEGKTASTTTLAKDSEEEKKTNLKALSVLKPLEDLLKEMNHRGYVTRPQETPVSVSQASVVPANVV